jgi:hypothetical protein
MQKIQIFIKYQGLASQNPTGTKNRCMDPAN